MEIIYITVSILVITFLVWLANKVLPFQVCPICGGVSLTWFLVLVGITLGWLSVTEYYSLVAILMGGTVVGMAYQGEKRMNVKPENFLKFRTAVVVPGFILVYLALQSIGWVTLIIEAAVLAAVTYLYFILPQSKKSSPERSEGKVAELEEKMKNCC